MGATSFSTDHMDEQVLVDVVAGEGRIRIPRALLPPLHSGDAEGWRPLSPLTVGDRQISGKFSLNFLNKPSVMIDRVTGHIELEGMGQAFHGDYRAYDPNTERKF